jgi:hypothetical protein
VGPRQPRGVAPARPSGSWPLLEESAMAVDLELERGTEALLQGAARRTWIPRTNHPSYPPPPSGGGPSRNPGEPGPEIGVGLNFPVHDAVEPESPMR